MNQCDAIAENLYAQTARKLKPLVIVVDHESNYVSHHGELADYQLLRLAPGQSVIGCLPFLVGLEEEDNITLPIVNFNTTDVCSVDVVRINQFRYVVLTEASGEHDRQFRITQTSNETKLLCQKLEDLTNRLENANKVKSRFISSMSHEFRTPLSSILGYSNLLAQNKSLGKLETQHAEAINCNAKYLLSLIDNVLEHAQLEKNKILINIAPFLLNELLVSIDLMFGTHAKRAGISFNITTTENLPEAMYSDQLRLQQILINLISNAFKFIEQGSVSIAFDWSDDKLFVTVADTGPGIPLRHQKDIFDAFSRHHANGKKGAGLGLNISSQIAEKLGGQLSLKSDVGEGAIFTLTVKAEAADAFRLQNDKKNPSGVAKCVLVVEDDEDLVDLLRIYIEEYGCKTVIAQDGEVAIKKCKSERIDLVLLDMQLPSLDGVGVARQLRQSDFDAPIIGMTASANNEDKIKAIDAGCDEFLTKPIQLTALKDKISTFLG